MIIFLVATSYSFTVGTLSRSLKDIMPPSRALSYDQFFSAKQHVPGTYVFTDMERLQDAELSLAAEYFRWMQEKPGFRALNDPARVKTRYALLRSLKEAGFNAFDIHRADGHPRPSRFPVFVRAEAEHRPALTDLLPDQAALDAALAELVDHGRPLRGLVVIEFCAEPIAPGLFQRIGMFRVGERLSYDHVVVEDHWNVKWGKRGLTTREFHEMLLEELRENRFAEEVRAAFELAGIDYGRADIGLLDGRPQVYEINTNPNINNIKEPSNPVLGEMQRIAQRRFAELLHAIDMPAAPAVPFHHRKMTYASRRTLRTLAMRGLSIDLPDLRTTRKTQDESAANDGRLREISTESVADKAAERERKLSEKHATETARLEASIKTLSGKTAERERRLLEKHAAETARLESSIKTLSDKAAERERRLLEKQATETARLNASIRYMEGSVSWRLTAPLRKWRHWWTHLAKRHPPRA